jgi:hypothetical protein
MRVLGGAGRLVRAGIPLLSLRRTQLSSHEWVHAQHAVLDPPDVQELVLEVDLILAERTQLGDAQSVSLGEPSRALLFGDRWAALSAFANKTPPTWCRGFTTRPRAPHTFTRLHTYGFARRSIGMSHASLIRRIMSSVSGRLRAKISDAREREPRIWANSV